MRYSTNYTTSNLFLIHFLFFALQVGLEYTDEYNLLLDDYLAKNAEKRAALKKSKSGAKEVHAYSLEDYGLSREQVEAEFADYINEYSLKEEKRK